MKKVRHKAKQIYICTKASRAKNTDWQPENHVTKL